MKYETFVISVPDPKIFITKQDPRINYGYGSNLLRIRVIPWAFFGNDIFDTSVSNHVDVSAEERCRVLTYLHTYHIVYLEIATPVCRSPCWIGQTKDSSGTVTCFSRSSAIPRCFSLVHSL